MRVFFFLCLFILSSCGCSRDEKPNFSNATLLEMARKGDPELKIILPENIAQSVVDCNLYTPACRYGVKVVVKKIEMKALFYDEQEDALKAAKRMRGYVTRNWALDDVTGEPILERFVVKYLEAEKAQDL